MTIVDNVVTCGRGSNRALEALMNETVLRNQLQALSTLSSSYQPETDDEDTVRERIPGSHHQNLVHVISMDMHYVGVAMKHLPSSPHKSCLIIFCIAHISHTHNVTDANSCMPKVIVLGGHAKDYGCTAFRGFCTRFNTCIVV